MADSGGTDRRPAQVGNAVLGVRLIGLLIASVGLWQLLANIAATWRDFDPSYIGYYLTSQMLRPAIGIAVGAALLLLGRRIGKWLARP